MMRTSESGHWCSFGSDIRKRTRRDMIRMSESGRQPSLSSDKIGKIGAKRPPGAAFRQRPADLKGRHSAILGGDNFVGLLASDPVQ